MAEHYIAAALFISLAICSVVSYEFCWFQHNHVYNTLTADQKIFEVCEKHPEHRVFVGELPAKFVNGRYAGEPSDKGEQDE